MIYRIQCRAQGDYELDKLGYRYRTISSHTDQREAEMVFDVMLKEHGYEYRLVARKKEHSPFCWKLLLILGSGSYEITATTETPRFVDNSCEAVPHMVWIDETIDKVLESYKQFLEDNNEQAYSQRSA